MGVRQRNADIETGPAVHVAASGLRGIPGVMGGIETHCEELYPRMVAEDPTLGITILGRSPYLPRESYSHRGVQVRPVWAVKNKYLETLLHTFVAVVKARLARRYSGMHLHAIGPGLLTPFARLLGMKVIVTHHGADYDRLKWGRVAKTILRTGERVSVRYANRTITVSRTTAEALRARFPKYADRIVHIPNGASLPDTTQDAQADDRLFRELGIEPGQYILAVGRLVPEKGFDGLVKAFVQSGTNRKLLIVGSADFDDAFSRALQATASDRVIFAGKRPRSDLATLYREASLFVLPSFHEGLPIVALEAIHSGTPILLSDIGPNKELGLGEGAYFPVGNIEALARALSLPPVPVDAQTSTTLRERYDWDRIARETAKVFHDVFD